MKQIISLNSFSQRLDFACDVDWHETHKFLKVEFPFNIKSLNASYEIQYGYIERPTHWNTSWEVAKFEVCAHKWADLSEHGFGVSVMNDCKYGYATHANVMRLSLLRSAKNPDPEADMGNHKFKYALYPHQGTFQQANIVRKSFEFNVPVILSQSTSQVNQTKTNSFFSVDNDAIIIDTIKKAEDNENLIVRFYESLGSRGNFTLSSSFNIKSIQHVNLLEKEIEVENKTELKQGGNQVTISFSPFEILTLEIKI